MINTNAEFSFYSFRLTDNFDYSHISLVSANMEFPHNTGYIFNKIVG